MAPWPIGPLDPLGYAMARMKKVFLVVLILLLPSAALLLFKQSIRVPARPAVIPVASPAGRNARLPRLNLSDSRMVRLSWVEPKAEGGHSLRFSKLTKDGWEAPRDIASGDNWFVNWADFPSLSAASERLLAAHWLERAGSGAYAYDIHLSVSTDGGRTWGDSLVPHHDGLGVEHGFVSLVPWQGGFGLVWLDGRGSGPRGQGAMGLRFTTLDVSGTGPETVLDARVCDCCQTAMDQIQNGLLVAYRDRTEEEVRDISVVRWLGGQWSEPVPVHRDGWRIDGCPVNGPALAARGETAAVAWYTGAGGEPRVNLAVSGNAGRDFAPPIRIDEGNPTGRVDLAFSSNGDWIVSWLEDVGDKKTRFQLRRVGKDSGLGKVIVVAEGDFSRQAGFPQMLVRGDDVVVAWTDVQEGATAVKTAIVRVASLR